VKVKIDSSHYKSRVTIGVPVFVGGIIVKWANISLNPVANEE